MDLEEARPPYIRDAFLALDALWFIFSMGFIFLSAAYNGTVVERGDVFDLTGVLAFLLSGISALSILIVIYAVFIKKSVLETSLKERFADSRHRYLMLLLFLFVPELLIFFIRPHSNSYNYMMVFTVSVLSFSFITPITVFFLSFKSSGVSLRKTMNRYLSVTVFFSLTLIFLISSIAILFPYLNPRIEFYMADDPTKTYYNEYAYYETAHLGVVNKGLLPARNITIMENGFEVCHIKALKGGSYIYVDVRIHCLFNETEENRTYDDYDYYPSSCHTNITLVYEGRVVDRITRLSPYQSTCDSIFLIMGAPAILLTKKMRKKRE